MPKRRKKEELSKKYLRKHILDSLDKKVGKKCKYSNEEKCGIILSFFRKNRKKLGGIKENNVLHFSYNYEDTREVHIKINLKSSVIQLHSWENSYILLANIELVPYKKGLSQESIDIFMHHLHLISKRKEFLSLSASNQSRYLSILQYIFRKIYVCCHR